MYYNNMNGNEEDLKFIPLNITEPFREKDSTWFPIIDMALPAFNEIPNSFVLNFITPMDNSNLQGNTLKTLDYIQNDNSNLQNNNQSAKEFEKDFNLEYPSETLSEELFSYNKEDKCKKGTSTTNNGNNNATNMQKTNPNTMSNFNGINNLNVSNNSSGMNNPNTMNNSNWMNNPNIMNNPNEMNNPNIMNNPNTTNNPNGMQNMNIKSMINNRNYMEEPIHMELLRNLSFGDYLTKSYRGEEDNNLDKVDMIYGSIKNDNSIMETFKTYNIPKPIYQLITKKIIKITLDDENCKRGE